MNGPLRIAPLLLAASLACSTDPAAPSGTQDGADGGDGAADGDSGDQPQDAGPSILGIAPAQDLDPADDVVEIRLTAAPAEVTWIDGEPTEVSAYNGQVPGPLIIATVGDTVRVIFENQLEEPTTIHWHGLRISDQMDGVPAIQAPVQPGETFTYEFVLPDSGTFWYHPHVRANEQIEHGLQGMLVVREAAPAEASAERAFVLDDVFLQSNGSFGSFNTNHMEQMHGRFGNLLLVNGQLGALTGSMRPEAPERWRLVNTANARPMSLRLSGARWRVIAMDGNLLPEPWVTSSVLLPIGRRVDAEVIAEEDEVKLDVVTSGDRFNLFTATVEGEPGDGAWLSWGATPFPEILPVEQEVELTLDGSSTETGLEWTINGATWADHEALQVDASRPTRILIHERSGADHPFHLHGQFFQVVSRNGVAEPRDVGLLDTVLVGGNDELELYTGFENPGRWMAHCHILEHAELGMMTEIVVD